LFNCFQKLSQSHLRRFIHKQMNMFGHQNVGIDPRSVPRTRLLNNGLERLFGFGCLKQWQAVKTTKGKEVQRLRVLKPPKTARHGPTLVAMILTPTPAHRKLRDERGTAFMLVH
jgi:hypothetical protein